MHGDDMQTGPAAVAATDAVMTGTLPAMDEPPLRHRPRHGPVPATATQRQYLRYLREHHGGVGIRTLHLCARFSGTLHVDILCAAIDLIVRRHESLRTRIVVDQDAAMQIIDAAPTGVLEIVDVNATQGDAIDKAQKLCVEFVTTKVDLAIGPLFAARLFRCHAREHVLVMAIDHAVADLASIYILFHEMCSFYQRGVNRQELTDEPVRMQYADYALWQAETFHGWCEVHAPYWVQRLKDAPCVRLPIEGLADHRERTRHPLMRIPLGEELSTSLRALARRQKTLLSVLMLAVHSLVMSRWCGVRDLVVKFVSQARSRPQLQGMVGFLANTLYLRIELARNDTFIALLERVRKELRAALEHQDLDRVPELIGECNSDICFNWVKAAGNHALRIDDLSIEPFMLDLPWTRPYFAMFLEETTGIAATVWHPPGAAGQAGARQFARLLVATAESCVQRPEEPLGDPLTNGWDQGVSDVRR